MSASDTTSVIQVVDLGRTEYRPVWERMRAYTHARTTLTPDQLWITQHEPVFTQGQAGRPEHLLAAGDIPVVASDRGGQVTYHGPGQLVLYPLVNLKGLGLSVRGFVSALENAMIATLGEFGVVGYARRDAPGVYVQRQGSTGAGEAKIGALGLRVRKGCSYHGLSLNVAMTLAPFAQINPCGMAGLAVTDLASQCGQPLTIESVQPVLVAALCTELGVDPTPVV